MENNNFNSIGIVRSCYKEKFGIPRQPSLVACPATIEIDEVYSKDEAFRELDSFSHIWVIFIFHGIDSKSWKSTVRPPRLGGNQRVGVFATRSMFRPNPIGMSVVELNSIERKGQKIILNITGGDFLDTTPVLDIKPYIPYADCIKVSRAGFAPEKPDAKLRVNFSNNAEAMIGAYKDIYPKLKEIIIGMLQLDPRPGYQEKTSGKNNFAIKLYDFDIKWCVENDQVVVTEIILLNI